jgi:hypothetical protein
MANYITEYSKRHGVPMPKKHEIKKEEWLIQYNTVQYNTLFNE